MDSLHIAFQSTITTVIMNFEVCSQTLKTFRLRKSKQHNTLRICAWKSFNTDAKRFLSSSRVVYWPMHVVKRWSRIFSGAFFFFLNRSERLWIPMCSVGHLLLQTTQHFLQTTAVTEFGWNDGIFVYSEIISIIIEDLNATHVFAFPQTIPPTHKRILRPGNSKQILSTLPALEKAPETIKHSFTPYKRCSHLCLLPVLDRNLLFVPVWKKKQREKKNKCLPVTTLLEGMKKRKVNSLAHT